MTHHPLVLSHISLEFDHKVCFKNFSFSIYPGEKIAIIGPNGSGKSSLLKIILNLLGPSEGTVFIPEGIVFGYLPQIVEAFLDKSGGERLNKALSRELAKDPDLFCLDEPTNHLDQHNRQSFFKWLSSYQNTTLIVSHDPELLRNYTTQIWSIEEGQIKVFKGSYDEWLKKCADDRSIQEEAFLSLKKEKRKAKRAIQDELHRAGQSRKSNRLENDRNLKGLMKESGSRSHGSKMGQLKKEEKRVLESLKSINIFDEINPRFSLKVDDVHPTKTLIGVVDGCCRYDRNLVLQNVHLQLKEGERMAITGPNGIGKTTLLRAIKGDPEIVKEGNWTLPRLLDIGYLDQHYAHLCKDQTPEEIIGNSRPEWSYQEVRSHLNDFLFRKNEEVKIKVHLLSGGEKARLSLAQISAQTPKLLLLDELTNNLDRITREHMVRLLSCYPGAILIVSHDVDFLDAIGVKDHYLLNR